MGPDVGPFMADLAMAHSARPLNINRNIGTYPLSAELGPAIATIHATRS